MGEVMWLGQGFAHQKATAQPQVPKIELGTGGGGEKWGGGGHGVKVKEGGGGGYRNVDSGEIRRWGGMLRLGMGWVGGGGGWR